MSEDFSTEPKLRHDPPDVPGYQLQDRPAIPINRLNLLAFPLAIPFGVFFFVMGALLSPGDDIVLDFSILNLIILLGLVLIAVPVLHEAVHGVVALMLGARPFFGIGQGFAYTTFLEPISPRQYMLISVAPLLILSVLSLAAFPLNADWFLFIVIFATANAAGSVGDLWIINRVRNLPSDALIYDLADGYAAFVPE